MTQTPFQLPDDLSKLPKPQDLATAEAIVAALLERVQAAAAEADAQAAALQQQIEALQHERDQLKRKLQTINDAMRLLRFRA